VSLAVADHKWFRIPRVDAGRESYLFNDATSVLSWHMSINVFSSKLKVSLRSLKPYVQEVDSRFLSSL
jgi:hypothetical protein